VASSRWVAPGSTGQGFGTRTPPSTWNFGTVLGGVKDALAVLGGCAVLDAASARWRMAIIDGGPSTGIYPVNLGIDGGLDVRRVQERRRTAAAPVVVVTRHKA